MLLAFNGKLLFAILFVFLLRVQVSYCHVIPWHHRDSRSPSDIMVDVINQLGLNILKAHNHNNENNIAVSPYGLTSILTVLLEGSQGRTALEIQQCGGFPADRDIIRVGLRDIHRLLRSYFIPQEGFLSGLSLSSETVTLKPSYQSILRFYGFDMTTFNTPIYPDVRTTTVNNSVTTLIEEVTTLANENVTETATPTTIQTLTVVEERTTRTRMQIPTTTMEQTTSTTQIPTTMEATSTTTRQTTETTTTTTTEQTTTTIQIPTTTSTEQTSTTTTTTQIPTTTTTTPTEQTSTTQTPTTTEEVTTSTTTSNPESTTESTSTTSSESTEVPSTGTTTMITTSTESIDTTSTSTESEEEQNATTIASRKRRANRSLSDYTLARYYDDDQNSDNSNLNNKHTSFLIKGKYHEPQVHFMTYDSILPFYYIRQLDALALRFPLDSPQYYLLLILPVDPHGIDRLICDIGQYGTLKQIVRLMRPTYVHAIIPNFMLRGFVILTSSLQKIGIQQMFEPRRAEFSPMTEDKDIYVTNIEQAITVTIKNYMDSNTINKNRNLYEYDPVQFRATQPFLYFVMDSEIDVALVAGKIVNPINSRIQ